MGYDENREIDSNQPGNTTTPEVREIHCKTWDEDSSKRRKVLIVPTSAFEKITRM